jgi:N6-adenosine-specific RNA methylase IME4
MSLAREDEPPLPCITGGFGGIVADPPWDYDGGQASRIRPGYCLMSVRDICDLPVESLAADKALLFLWVTASFTEAGFRVMRAWGFEPKAQIVWAKGRVEDGAFVEHIGMGSYVRNSHELVLIGSRGGQTSLNRSIGSVLIAPRGRHSVKPEQLLSRVEELAPGPYLELFARTARPGWAAWGNEIAA